MVLVVNIKKIIPTYTSELIVKTNRYSPLSYQKHINNTYNISYITWQKTLGETMNDDTSVK